LIALGKEAIQEKVIEYVKFLVTKKLSYASIKIQIAGIYYFLDGEDISLNKPKIRRYLPYHDEPKQPDRPYTVAELQKLLAVCDLRTRIIVLIMASAGLRIDAVRELQIGDLCKLPVRHGQNMYLYKIQVYARSRHSYYTFCTPECARAIDDYLVTRQRFGEELRDKFPLIREEYNRDDPIRMKSPRHLTTRTIAYLINDALVRSGVRTDQVMASHGFRKFFMSTAEQSPMKSINVKYLMGHSLGVEDSYYHPKDSDILEDYMKAVDALTIDPTQRLKKKVTELAGDHSQRIEQLEKQMMRYQESFIINDKIAKRMGLSKKEFEDVLLLQHKRKHPEDRDKNLKCVLDSEY
jgi:integrase